MPVPMKLAVSLTDPNYEKRNPFPPPKVQLERSCCLG